MNAGEPAFCKKPDSPAPPPAKTLKWLAAELALRDEWWDRLPACLLERPARRPVAAESGRAHGDIPFSSPFLKEDTQGDFSEPIEK